MAYEGDLKLAKRLLQDVASKVVDPQTHRAAAEEYVRLTRGMAMERTFPAEPVIQVALEDDWVALRLRYLVDARRRGTIRSSLADAWQEAIAAYPTDLPPIYRRSQVQRIGADGRPQRQT